MPTGNAVFRGEKVGAAEAAKYCGFQNRETFTKRVKNGSLRIPYFQMGKRGHLRFMVQDLDDFLAGQRKQFGSAKRGRA